MQMVVERCVAFRDALELVVKVDDDLAQRNVERQFHAVAGNEFLFEQLAAFAQAESHNRADKVSGGYYLRADVWLVDMIDEGDFRKSRGVVHLRFVTFLVVDFVAYVGHSSYHFHAELAA